MKKRYIALFTVLSILAWFVTTVFSPNDIAKWAPNWIVYARVADWEIYFPTTYATPWYLMPKVMHNTPQKRQSAIWARLNRQNFTFISRKHYDPLRQNDITVAFEKHFVEDDKQEQAVYQEMRLNRKDGPHGLEIFTKNDGTVRYWAFPTWIECKEDKDICLLQRGKLKDFDNVDVMIVMAKDDMFKWQQILDGLNEQLKQCRVKPNIVTRINSLRALEHNTACYWH